ncbi:MAG: hypothetical protein CMJ26_00395 [Phycisphaerae bacterium]|nr:hypothetical protein [Phycisphaerae bacterium]
MHESSATAPEIVLTWPLPSIIEAVSAEESWRLFAPESEPFYDGLAHYQNFRTVPTAKRGVVLAIEKEKPAIVFVPNRQISSVYEFCRVLITDHPIVLVVEDHPALASQLLPRERAKQAGISVIEPCDSTEIQYCASAAVSFSHSLRAPVVLLLHHRLLASSATEVRKTGNPYQALSSTVESTTPLHLGRRLELNRQRTLPSPGEQVEVGFITLGESDLSLKYLVSELQLLGRVPMLNVRLVHPIDKFPVERLLSRCRHVVVLEPRPGEVEQEIIRIAQSMRREGREVASIWGKQLPPFTPEGPAVPVPVNAIHPSVVARLTQHLLKEVSPSANISELLSPEFALLEAKPTKRTEFGTKGALDLLRSMAERVLCHSESNSHVLVDGFTVKNGEGSKIFIETWGEDRFLDSGINVLRYAVSRDETRVIIVWRNFAIGSALMSLISAILPSKSDDGKQVLEVAIDQGEELDKAIENASAKDGVSVIVVRDSEDPRFDLRRLAEVASQVDKLGFRQQHAIVIPMEQLTPVRIVPFDPWKTKTTTPAMPLETSMSTRWLEPDYRRWSISLRPILERVEVTRSKPPVRVVTKSTAGLAPPKVLHGSAPNWRVHIAGSRGTQPGVVGNILIHAGIQMGYDIRVQCNNRFVGPGRCAWSQILYTRKQTTNSYRPLIGSIPWGEADLLLGWDREEVLRAIDPAGNLRVSTSAKTFALVNIDLLEHQTEIKDENNALVPFDDRALSKCCNAEKLILRGFASLARVRFHNERLGDVVQLGMAFQMGYIPATVDAMLLAVHAIEKKGFARSAEAFEFGRRVAIEADDAWKPIAEETKVDLAKLEKRCVRDLQKQGGRSVANAEVVKRLLRQCRQSLPGLYESVDGRQSLTDIMNGIRRCMLWGGEEVATKFLKALCKVYEVDSAENGRQLTRNVILPLAESMLIRDPIYLARLARSPEILRRIRKQLNVRHSRGDTLKRRFLSRFRLRLWKWSLQVDLRTSDWSSVFVSGVGRFVPRRWRGHKRDKAVRETISDAINNAITSPDCYDHWVDVFANLNKLALESKWHTTSLEEIKKIIQQ